MAKSQKDNLLVKRGVSRNKLNSESGIWLDLFNGVARILSELRWVIYAMMAIALILMLFSYSPEDPGFVQTSSTQVVHNMLGVFGAYVAQGLLYLMGFSSWLLVVLLIRRMFVGYKRLMKKLSSDTEEGSDTVPHRIYWEQGLGYVLLFLSVLGFESVHNSTYANDYPLGAGGLLGYFWGNFALEYIGSMGSLALFSALFVIGSGLFFNFSWLNVCEKIGSWVSKGVARIRRSQTEKKDLKIGEAALLERQGTMDQKEHHLSFEERAEEVPEVQAPTVELVNDTIEEAAVVKKVAEPPVVKITHASTTVKQSKSVPTDVFQPTLFPTEVSQGSKPTLDLLDPPSHQVEVVSTETIEYTSRLIEKKLSDFNINVKVVSAYAGPVITRYEIEPATGVKGSQIVNLATDLARSLSLVRIRVIETIPGKNLMGLELPNPKRQVVHLSEIIASKAFADSNDPLTVALGKDIAGAPVVGNLAKMPHLLVAGTTGSGKSVGINAMILSLLYKSHPDEVKLILIDPKMLEMAIYEGIPHLIAPVVTEMSKAGNALNWCVAEMDKRYKLLSKLGVRNIAAFNQKVKDANKKGTPIAHPFSLTPESPEPLQPLPYIVIIIDELADLMMVVGKKIEELIARLAQKARAAGIHLILATQRPSVDVITGLIKANVPTRIAFQVSSKIDSRTILDQMGAETLLGLGDMLYLKPGTGVPERVHGAFVSDDEVQRVVDFLKESYGEAQYVDGVLDGPASGEGMPGFVDEDGESDPLYDQAVAIVLKSRRASISYVQRNLKIGYNRAARLLEQMEQAGIVSAMQSNGSREILVSEGSMDHED
ncbi:DNA translocase FtsK [Basilea psittacipulmonis]|uniref:DNA translocase FtsK n=1 Tax=Basilea psittacipulmonis TaxID=1472345 RepID=UPI0009879999|nr:DNA translocase FtsK [Basilea psittacipulmonis]